MTQLKTLNTAKDLIRSVISAPEDKHLVVADYANIEGRILPWLAGEDWKVQAFIDYDKGIGPDLYKVSYHRLFGAPIDEITDQQRLIGKVVELACGYQGWIGAFHSMAKVYGVDVPDDVAIDIVKAWRNAHPETVSFWYTLEDTAILSALNENKVFEVGVLKFLSRDKWTHVVLPSGRSLSYYDPQILFDNERGKNYFSYMGFDTYSRKWTRLKTYGGKWAENIVQGVARDILANAMLRIDKCGFEIVLTVHDEIVCEEFIASQHNLELMTMVMTQNPDWATGLPLAAEGYEAKHYRKG